MLFNSLEFFIFFSIILLVYYGLVRFRNTQTVILWLLGASIFFYAWWRAEYLALLLGSIVFNYFIGLQILKHHEQSTNKSKTYLWIGIVTNILLLGYYKYTNFLLDNLRPIFPFLSHQNIILPLGISFFTFTQIAYLVDAYYKKAKEYSFSKYVLFVTYFPHLIAGPILHHRDMIPQFDLKTINNSKRFQNIYYGLLIFLFGLFKKVIIADTLATFATKGFDETGRLYFVEGWLTAFAYTFQLFFDFSGYSDMAVGLSLILQINLPLNFNCPYTALNIQDFWKRWHMTLSNFLRDYIYIPLGGNRRGELRTYINLILTFLIGGIWHGAGWLFLLWGAMHGLGLVIHRKFQDLKIRIPTWTAWFVTFIFVSIAWVFFRAHEMKDALKVFKGMLGLKGWISPNGDIFTWQMLWEQFTLPFDIAVIDSHTLAILILIFSLILAIILTIKNTHEIVYKLAPNWATISVCCLMTLYVLLKLNKASEFLYFNF